MGDELAGFVVVCSRVRGLAVEFEAGERSLVCNVTAVGIVRGSDALACKEHGGEETARYQLAVCQCDLTYELKRNLVLYHT